MFNKIFNRKQLSVLFLGFTSGLPLALTGTALQAWLTVENIDIKTIGYFSLVGLPYTFKFLWAPLMDRFELPFLGRRKSWLMITQILLAISLFFISQFSPTQSTQFIALIALFISFFSASQDIVIDAYRTDILLPEERGLGSSLSVLGYRLAMLISGGVAFVWADSVSGSGYSWNKIYTIMAMIMAFSSVISLILLPSIKIDQQREKSNSKNDLIGFLAVTAAVVAGYFLTTLITTPLSLKLMTSIFSPLADGTANPNAAKWGDMLGLLSGIIITLPLAYWSSNKAKFETLNNSLKNYFSIKGAVSFLAIIILYKLGDAFAGSLMTNFLIKTVGFAQAEIGVVNKIIGMWLTIGGAIVGGMIMIRLGLYRSLLFFGVLQLLSNVGFYILAVSTKGSWGSFTLPAFDIYLISLKEATSVDYMLLFAIGIENLTGGMGTAAFVAFLMALCNQKFTATQYALLTALSSIGRVWVGPLSGVLIDSIGWPQFFILSMVAAVPGLWMIYLKRNEIRAFEGPKEISLADD